MRKQRLISLCLASALALSLSLAGCNSPTDEQNSDQPTPSAQPTAAPTPPPTPPIPFADVTQDSPYYDAVVWAYKNGIASDGETFGPADACTRGQVMTFLWRAKGSPEPQATESPFSDVSSDDWFYKPALWAYENGVATGTAFNPGNPCTNGEALTFLWRAEGKPAASMYHSAVALAASGAYYARPAAWAEANGLFSGAEFDPAAPCSRAELMMYLHWVTEEWTFAEEDKAVQAEYEQIINDAQLYEVHGSGLVYADYVDVDSDGKVELLTVDSGENLSSVAGWPSYIVTATVYTDVNGHAEKLCEQAFSCTSSEGSLYLCVYDGHVCFGYEVLIFGAGPQHDFYKIENSSFVVNDSVCKIRDRYGDAQGNYITEDEYNAVMAKYANQKELFWFNSRDGISVKDRGLLPDPSAVMQKIYAAVKNGDFSFFAGTYHKSFGDSFSEKLTLNEDGTLSGGNDYNTANNQKPVSITVTSKGIIRCVITPVGLDNHYDEWSTTWHGDIYDICPIGIEWDELAEVDGDVGLIHNITTDTNSLRIVYTNWGGSAGADTGVYYK